MRSTVIAASTFRTQPDVTLARLAGHGSEAAFEEIVRRYRSGLVAFAAKICSRDSADDVVQDSMVKAHSALRRGDLPDSPRAWLFRIVRNTALNERRDHRVHDHLDESFDGVEQPPEVAERRRELRELVAAIGDLPRAQREALVQRELEGKGHDEIAAHLKVSPGAVRQLIFRARSALRAGLGALLPVQLLRAAVLSGATEQAGSGAVATGAGVAAKLGLGALLTTGALVAGAHSVKDPAASIGHRQGDSAGARQADHASALPVAHRSSLVDVVHRHVVIVSPRTTAAHSASASLARAASGSPQSGNSGSSTHGGAAPPPAGTGGTGGGGGGHPDGNTGSAQGHPAPSSRDCSNGGDRDPGPGGVSPG
jgi:RNA polymerase sigma factor (sigma-70 family)